jgi:hypothetical protein
MFDAATMQPTPKMSCVHRPDADCRSETAETLVIDDMTFESFR